MIVGTCLRRVRGHPGTGVPTLLYEKRLYKSEFEDVPLSSGSGK